MADTETNWTWNLPGSTTSSKALGRPFLSKDTAWDLIGVDGNATDTVKTHPGFRAVDRFTLPGSVTRKLVNVFPATILLSATASVSGYVLVVEETVSAVTKFYYRFKTPTGWVLANSGSPLWTVSGVSLEVDVQVLGKFLYLFCRGQTPQLNFPTSGSGIYAVTFTTANAGAGTSPLAATAAGRTTSTLTFGADVTNDLLVAETTNTTSKALLTGGRYSFAVQYMDSNTGRKTPLSKPVELTVALTAIGSTPASDNPSKVSRGVLYAIRYKAGYDKALLYRSVNQGSGGTAGPLQLETIVTWAVGDTANKESQSVQNTDRVLVYKDVYIDRGSLLPNLPAGGVAQFLEGTLFVSRISGAVTLPNESTPPTPPAGIGELRWSSTTEILPENFGPFNRWVPPTPANEVVGMKRVGGFMLGFSTDRIYHFRRQGANIRIEEMHPGYGLGSRYGIESVANIVYFVSPQGLKAVSSEGQLDDVKGLDWLFQSKLSTLPNVQLSYDAKGMCLHIMWGSPGTTPNPDGHMAIMWFNTSRLTELADIPFKFVRTGDVPNTLGITERRSMFFKPQNDTGTKWAFFVADYDKQGAPGTGLVQFTGSGGVAPVCSIDTYLNECASGWLSADDARGDIVGTALYTLGPTAGYPYLFTRFNEAELRSQEDVYGTYPELLSNNSPAVVGLAPIKFQWTGSNFGYDPGATGADMRDFFRSKQVSSMRAYIRTEAYDAQDLEVLAGEGVTPTIGFQLFRDTDSTPCSVAIPIHRDGTPTPALLGNDRDRLDMASFGQGVFSEEGKKHGVSYASLSPSVMCVWPTVTINLLALSVKGKILDSDRRYV